MATLNYKILPNRRKASGKLGVYLSLTHKHEVRYISTEFEIDDESEFEDGLVCYRKDAALMNKRMAYKAECLKAIFPLLLLTASFRYCTPSFSNLV